MKKSRMRHLFTRKGDSLNFKKMKLTLICFFLVITSGWANSYSQTTKLSLNLKNVLVQELIQQIENQTDFYFLYQDDIFKKGQLISICVENESLDLILRQLEDQASIKSEITEHQIVLKKIFAEEGLFLQQEKQISGIVTGVDGLPIPGVSVIVKGSTIGIVTDKEGIYKLLDVPEDAVLQYSFIGLKTKEIAISEKNIINVVMEEETIGLDEIIAVGYGTMKKSDLTGSVVSVRSDEIVKMPAFRVDQALQGKISGVSISNDKAQPGSEPIIRIRGDNSIYGNNDPLVVVDGVLGVSMSMINPNEVESIEILKDASSTAIYGSRGSNGVIIITTKRGEVGKTKFDFSSYYSVATVANKLDMLDASQHAEALQKVLDFDRISNPEQYETMLGMYNSNVDTDWQDEIFRNGPVKNYALNVSGGAQNTRYSLSGSIFTQDGIIESTSYDRQTLRFTLDQIVSKRLSFGTTFYLGKSIQDNTRVDTSGGSWGGSITQGALRWSPIQSVYNEDGRYTPIYPTNNPVNNPMALINERTNQYKNLMARINIFALYEIIDGLTLRSSYSYDYSGLTKNYWAGKEILESSGFGIASITNSSSNYWLNENILTFDKVINKHQITVLGGFTASGREYAQAYAEGSEFATEVLEYNSLEMGETPKVSSALTESTMTSFLGRVNYVYNNKYLLTVNFRADGSSKFAANNKWGYFPSASIGWRISEENFLKASDKISNLKLRVSHGVNGSQAISAYESLASYAVTNVPFGGNTYVGIISDQIANKDLKWETTEQFNVGIDFGMFNNRIGLVADYYVKNTKDLLYSKQVPYYTGYSSQTQNIGKVRNKGFEFALNTVNIDRKFKWNTSFNITFNTNEVIDLGGDEYALYDGSGGCGFEAFDQSVILQVGEPLGSFYGYVFDGIYQNQAECDALPYPVSACEPGQVKLKDIAGAFDEDGNPIPDGQITTEDRTIIGCARPDFIFGFGNDFSYKAFDMNIMFQGSVGNDIMNVNRVRHEKLGLENSMAYVLTEGWEGEGTSNTIQAPGESIGPCSSRFIEDGTYVRLKNISLGYTLPTNVTSRWGISNLRVYVSGQNLFTITDYSWYDPEINSRSGNIMLGCDYGGYPTSKTFTVGVNLSF